MKLLTLDGLTYYISKIKAWIDDNFVAKVEGKGLSTNDYTTTEKNKLSGIATGAQVNKIESVKVNGTALSISSKAVNIDLSNYATKGDVSAIPKFAVTVVTSLPTSNISTSTIYLMANAGEDNNSYDEYIYVNSAWEKIGTTKVDLSGYYTSSQVDTKLGAKQNTLTAGTNVTISGSTISAKDTTYSAATASAAGLMSAADKTKLDGIATGANKTTVDSSLSSTSTNPVQNKVINSALAGKLSTSGTAAKATADASGNNIVDTYETKANAITGLSVSGKTITYTKGDGTTGTITTQDTNTDVKVKQTNSTGTSAYPILLKNGTGTGEVTNGVLFDDGVTIQPSTGKITATTFSGALSGNATSATKATQDASGNVITETYETKANAITGLSVSGKTITYTKGNGTTGTITTQDTDTTYSNMTAATASAAGKAGLVPAPAAGKQSSFLRGDGTWATPSNTKNTAGSTDSSSKLFLIGATSQAANPQTYSHDTAYVGTDGCLYSGGVKVATTSDLVAITNAEIDAALEA